MEAFGKAFGVMRQQPGRVFGLMVVFASGTLILSIAAVLLALVVGFSSILTLVHNAANGIPITSAVSGSAIIGLGATVLVVGLVAILGGVYLSAGLLGCLGTVFDGDGLLQVNPGAFLRFANRYFLRLLGLGFAALAGGMVLMILAGVVAWLLHGSIPLLILWLVVAAIVLVLFYLPIMNLGNAAVVLGDQGGMAAYGTGLGMVRRSPLSVSGISLILLLLGGAIGLAEHQLLGPLQFIGFLLMMAVNGIVAIYGGLVWFFAYQEAGVGGSRRAD